MLVSAEAPPRSPRLTVLHHDGTPASQERIAATRAGPLLAICGICGGAGVTTLAYLTALSAARGGSNPVLVADTGGPTGGLAAVARLEAPRSLPELADQIAAGLTPRNGLYATDRSGLRILATGPEFSSSTAPKQITQLFIHAREAHALTVVDCGTLARPEESAAAKAATHTAWVMPATKQGASRARRVLDAAPRFEAADILVARRDIRESNASLRALRHVAFERGAPLVLVPHLAGLDDGKPDHALEQAQIPVQAILGAVGR